MLEYRVEFSSGQDQEDFLRFLGEHPDIKREPAAPQQNLAAIRAEFDAVLAQRLESVRMGRVVTLAESKARFEKWLQEKSS